MEQRPTRKATQRRVLVLIDHVESDYPVEMISGVLRATRVANVNTLIVAGGGLSTPSSSVPRNFVYDLLPGADIDGMLVLAGSLSNQAGAAAFREWLGRFQGIPVVCIGLDIPGYPSVFVDNEVGVHATVSHLVQHHGRRKIGCITGPRESVEGKQRHAAYERAMKEHGLAIDPRLVVSASSLGRQDGHAIIAEWFDRRGISANDVDGLACFNDDIALGVLEALTRRGVVVPERIALVGFDDASHARTANPPLSTVNQRVELQGYAAARALLDALESGSRPRSERIESREVIRASCGCVTRYSNDSSTLDVDPKPARSLALAFLGRRETMKAEMARAAAGRLGSQNGWEEKVLAALAQDLDRADGGFRLSLENVARRAIAVGGTVDACNDVLTSLRLQLLGIAVAQPEARPRIEDMFQETRLTLTHVALAAYRERDQAAQSHLRNIGRPCLEALATRDSDAWREALTRHLPPLGIAAGAVSRLRESPRQGRQLEVLARLSPDFADAKPQTLPITSLGLDQALQHRAAVILLPLEFGGRPLGIACLAWGAHNPLVYEPLREQLSLAVYAAAAAPGDESGRDASAAPASQNFRGGVSGE